MKDCGDCRENIVRYLDEQLSVPQAIEFRAHLETCEACGEVLRAEEQLSRILHRSRPLYSAPSTLRDRILQASKRPSPMELPPQ